MLIESSKGKLNSGQQLTIKGRGWLFQGAWLSLCLDWTIIGGAMVRLWYRIPFYLRPKKSPLLKNSEEMSTTINIAQAGEIEDQTIIEQREEEIRAIMADQDEEGRIIIMEKLSKESENDKNSRAIYQKLRNEKYASKEGKIASNNVGESKENRQASRINPKSISSQKPLNDKTRPEAKQVPKPFVPGNQYKRPVLRKQNTEVKNEELEKSLMREKKKEEEVIEVTNDMEKKSDAGFVNLIKNTLKHDLEK